MKTKALSASRLKTWLQCKYKYGCIYHKLAPKPKAENKDYLLEGNAVHEALSYAGHLVKDEAITAFEEEHINEIVKVYKKE